jgi:putative nucleotidyltransferase with HDIG domain/PAS domain S-box-containing protein
LENQLVSDKPLLRILIIEDSEDDSALLLWHLKKEGYEIQHKRVETAIALRQALEEANWDAIISDYNLPSFSGLGALSIYKEKDLRIPFIIVSGNIGEEIAVEAMKAGAHDYVMRDNLARLVPAIERERRETETRRMRKRAEKVQEATYKISQAASEAGNLQELFRSIHSIVIELMPARHFYVALYEPDDKSLSYLYYASDDTDQNNDEESLKVSKGLTQHVLKTARPLLVRTDAIEKLILSGQIEPSTIRPISWLGAPLKTKDDTIGVLAIQSFREGLLFSEEDLNILAFVSTQVAMAVARKKAEDAIRRNESRYRSLFENSPISLWEEDFSEVRTYIDNLKKQGINNFRGYFTRNPQATRECMQKIRVLDVNQATLKLYGARTKDELVGNLDLVLRDDTQHVIMEELIAIAEGKQEFEGIGVNYKLNGEPVECVISWTISPTYQDTLSKIVVSVVDITDRKRAEEQIRSQLERLGALRTVDMAITASLDLRVTLDVLLDQVTLQLQVDAANILLLNPHSQLLIYAAGRGFRGVKPARASLPLTDPYAGKSVLERKVLAVLDLSRANDFLQSRSLNDEDFAAYICVPLQAKGQIKGVLEVFHRGELSPNPDWIDFLETLAGQAAIAIDNASLFENLQRSNIELALAYDATIEGWSRALDLRDRETEGHTERVTDLTMKLASLMGLPEEDLIYVRRGALLHDIGKMGISDSILLKPGPLSEKEWQVMRQHPIYAYELLSPIIYLRPSLDIPYCHHEKWDGSGYPRGLKGEQIPLAARIFAIADVWDALRSDRPYRPAWEETKVCEFIRCQSGHHFDPKIADLFLNLIEQGDLMIQGVPSP